MNSIQNYIKNSPMKRAIGLGLTAFAARQFEISSISLPLLGLIVAGQVAAELPSLLQRKISVIQNDYDQKSIDTQTQRLITPEMNRESQQMIRNQIAEIPKNERETVVTQSLRLVDENDDDGRKRAAIVSAIAKIPSKERLDIVSQVLRVGVSPQEIDHIPLPHLFATIQNLGNERHSIITLALRLITPGMYFPFKQIVIQTIARITPNEREARVQRALDRFPPGLDYHLDDFHIFRQAIVILETPMNQPIINPDAEMAELAAHGQNAINVHSGQRDAKTMQAIDFLRTHQGVLRASDIAREVAEFQEYLNNFGEVDTQAKARQALNGEHEIWPPLLYEYPHHISDGRKSLEIHGSEFIARLWKFSKSHPEKENCRLGMVRALSDSICEVDGKRICPPGQMQKQVLAVLQGRLAGVDVDSVGPTLNQLISALTNKPHSSRATLMADAEEVLSHNLTINREAFLKELNDYADLQELI